MARKPRIHYQEAIYHVIVRGNNREYIFQQEEEKVKYLQILASYKKRYGFQLYAYVLMDNHAHLLVHIGKTPLAKIMQGVQQTYTQYYNRYHKHSGHVFEQRYKAYLCQHDSYLLTLLCYIHQNPVRANLKEGLDYPWSSHASYVNSKGNITDKDTILEMFSSNRNKAVKEYLDMIGVRVNKPVYSEQQELTEPPLETQQIKPLKKENKSLEIKKVTWEELVDKVVREEGIAQQDLLGKCRIRKVVAARKRLIYDAIESLVKTRAELSVLLLMDPSNVTRMYQQEKESIGDN